MSDSMCIKQRRVAVVGDDTRRVIARRVVPAEATALLELVRGLRGAIHVPLEGGTQAENIGPGGRAISPSRS